MAKAKANAKSKPKSATKATAKPAATKPKISPAAAAHYESDRNRDLTTCGNYLLIQDSMRSGFCIFGFLKNFESRPLLTGVSAKKDWPEAGHFVRDPDKHYKDRTELSDLLTNGNNLLLASTAFCDFLKAEKVPDLEFLPATVFDKKKPMSSDYFVVNPLSVQDCVDVEKSEVTRSTILPEQINYVKKLHIDESKIDPKAVIFRAKGMVRPIFVRQDLALKIQKQGFSNIIFKPVSEYTNS